MKSTTCKRHLWVKEIISFDVELGIGVFASIHYYLFCFGRICSFLPHVCRHDLVDNTIEFILRINDRNPSARWCSHFQLPMKSTSGVDLKGEECHLVAARHLSESHAHPMSSFIRVSQEPKTQGENYIISGGMPFKLWRKQTKLHIEPMRSMYVRRILLSFVPKHLLFQLS